MRNKPGRGLFLLLLSPSLFCAGVHAQSLSPRDSTRIQNSRIGVMSGFLRYDANIIGDDIIDKFKEAGVKWERILMDWPYYERSPGVYRTDAFDVVGANINKLKAAGITPYLCVNKANPVYSSSAPAVADPANLAAWLNYVSTVTYRFKDLVNHYEIWNEQNFTDSWLPAPDGASYADLVKRTSPVIKAKDPQAIIIMGGTALLDVEFIRTCFDEGVAPYIDAVAIHPYRPIPEKAQSLIVGFSPNTGFDFSYASYEAELDALKSIIRKSGRNIGIWITEICHISDSRNPASANLFRTFNSETTQAKYLLRAYLWSLGLGVDLVTWTLMHEYQSLSQNNDNADWYDNYLDRPVQGLEFSMGLIRTPPLTTVLLRAATDYDSLIAPMAAGASYVYNSSALTTTDGRSVYNLNLSEAGVYTIWGRLMNIGASSPGAFLDYVDAIPDFRFMVTAAQTADKWAAAYANDTPFLWQLPAGAHSITVNTYTPSTRLDELRLVKVDPDSERKPAYFALQNLCSLFDSNVSPLGTIETGFYNVNVPPATWGDFRKQAFLNAETGEILIAYWLGIEAADALASFRVDLNVSRTNFTGADLIDPLNNTITQLAASGSGDNKTWFRDIPVSDYPLLLRLNMRAQPDTLKKIYAYPNPYRSSGGSSYVTFTNLPPEPTIRVYTVSGTLVWEVKNVSNDGSYQWDLKNMAGRGISSGTYVYVVSDRQGRTFKGRIALIK